nr:nuclear pore complex protein NUP98B-like isoform X5 [Nicotiana tomentosiformis]
MSLFSAPSSSPSFSSSNLFGNRAFGATSSASSSASSVFAQPIGSSVSFGGTKASSATNNATAFQTQDKSLGSSSTLPTFGKKYGGNGVANESLVWSRDASVSAPAFGVASNSHFGMSSTPTFGSCSFDMPAVSTSGISGFGGLLIPRPFNESTVEHFGMSSTPRFGSYSFGQPAVSVSALNPLFSSSNMFGSTPEIGQTQPLFGNRAFGETSSASSVFAQPIGSSVSFNGTTTFNAANDATAFQTQDKSLGSSTLSTFGKKYEGNGVANKPLLWSRDASVSAPALGVASNSHFGMSSTPAFGSYSSVQPAVSTSGISGFGGLVIPRPFDRPAAFVSGKESTAPLLKSFSFGKAACGFNQNGSRIASYIATPEKDSTKPGETIQSICGMHTYKDKSQEELRFEDYQLGDKGISGFGVIDNSRTFQSPVFNQSTVDHPNPFAVKREPSSGHCPNPFAVKREPSYCHCPNPFAVEREPFDFHPPNPCAVKREPSYCHCPNPFAVEREPFDFHPPNPFAVKREPFCSHCPNPFAMKREPSYCHCPNPFAVERERFDFHPPNPFAVKREPSYCHCPNPFAVEREPFDFHPPNPFAVKREPFCSHCPNPFAMKREPSYCHCPNPFAVERERFDFHPPNPFAVKREPSYCHCPNPFAVEREPFDFHPPNPFAVKREPFCSHCPNPFAMKREPSYCHCPNPFAVERERFDFHPPNPFAVKREPSYCHCSNPFVVEREPFDFHPPNPFAVKREPFCSHCPNPFAVKREPSYCHCPNPFATKRAGFDSLSKEKSTTTPPGTGTRVASYAATREVEGQYSIKFLSISAMPLYSNKSHEELRLEDYESANKGAASILQSKPFESSSGSTASNVFFSPWIHSSPFAAPLKPDSSSPITSALSPAPILTTGAAPQSTLCSNCLNKSQSSYQLQPTSPRLCDSSIGLENLTTSSQLYPLGPSQNTPLFVGPLHPEMTPNVGETLPTAISSHPATVESAAEEATDSKHDDKDVDAIMPKLQRSDYYTVPPIQELISKEKEEPGFCTHVTDFVVGRHGYGSIKFLGETDVRKLDLDSAVHFNCREVIIYMDESKKPPVGQGLNKPAEITLLNVRCINKSTGKEYTDGPIVNKYRDMLIKKAGVHGAEFVSYDPVKGEWAFKVSHF